MPDRVCPTSVQLSDYVDGRLSEEEHQSIDHHLDGCHPCQSAVETLDQGSETQLASLNSMVSTPSLVFDEELCQLIEGAKRIDLTAPFARVEVSDSFPFQEGDLLGNYKLDQLLGAGGMGRVYKASHLRMKREVAVKFLSPALVTSPIAKHRFEREVQVAAKLTHNHVVAAYDADETDGHFFLVMEYVPGSNLNDWVKQLGPLSVVDAVSYLLQAAEGLAYAHQQGIVHRDIKPANLLLSSRGVVKVLDMGLARFGWATESGADSETTDHVPALGTVAYMAPEQGLNFQQAGQQADIYSLGCTLHYLLTGRAVYSCEQPADMLLAHRKEPIPSLIERRSDCPERLDRLFQAMLAKQPQQRPSDMASVIAELKQIHETLRPVKPSQRTRGLHAVWAIGVVALLAGVLAGWPWVRTWLLPAETPDGGSKSQVANRHPSTGSETLPLPKMVRIEAGTFQMGAAAEEQGARPNEQPQHQVTLTRPFFLGKFEVTRELYERVMQQELQQADPPSGESQAARMPISGISWEDAVRFCNRLSQLAGLKPYYRIQGTTVSVLGGNGFRLPTEAEWEFACRAGSTSPWHSGQDASLLQDHGWIASNSQGRLHPVGLKKPNAWGLYDMHGNCPEWCWDRYGADYYAKSARFDPTGATNGSERVFRGGSFRDLAPQCRSAVRATLGKSYGFMDHVGFRIARDAPLQR